MTKLLQIKNLDKIYFQNKKELKVLSNINIEINKGEFVCILGPSGCGKTTLLSILGGFDSQNRGNIFLDSKEVLKPSLERMMIFQNSNQLFPWKNIFKNVMFPLMVKKIGGSEEEREFIANKYLNLVGLDNFKNYYPHQLSGGMKQRAAIARALVLEPEILLMDEPFSSLDMLTREKLQRLIINIWEKTKSTIIFVTHDLNEAITLADKIIVMGKSPNSIKKIINLNIKRPRVRDEKYNKIFNEIYSLLGD